MTATLLNTKVSEVENKIHDHGIFIAAQECIELLAENFAARLEQANLVNKTYFDNKLTSSNKQITLKQN